MTDSVCPPAFAADWLEELAQQVRAGSVIGFEAKWKLGAPALESTMQLRAPVEFLKIDINLGPVVQG